MVLPRCDHSLLGNVFNRRCFAARFVSLLFFNIVKFYSEVASSDQSLVLSTNQTLFWSIFSNGAFEIFGELNDETKEGVFELYFIL